MIFAVGDLVTIDAAKTSETLWYPAWVRLNGKGSFLITKIDDMGIYISFPDGSPIKWDNVLGDGKRGIWDHWLQPQPFLTAARKAIETKGETSVT